MFSVAKVAQYYPISFLKSHIHGLLVTWVVNKINNKGILFRENSDNNDCSLMKILVAMKDNS